MQVHGVVKVTPCKLWLCEVVSSQLFLQSLYHLPRIALWGSAPQFLTGIFYGKEGNYCPYRKSNCDCPHSSLPRY